MEKGKNDLSPYVVCAMFFAVLGIHLFLAIQWQRQFLIYFYGSSDCFTDAVSWAYQRMVHFQQDFSVFYKFDRLAVGRYWPPVVPLMGLWTLLVLPVQWLFLPNFIYLAMIMLGIYGSVRFLTANQFYGMLAAVIFSCYWIVLIQLVTFELQLAVTACMVWSFYWYLRSFFFTRFWPSLLVGSFMALALYCDRVTPGLFVFALFLVPENFRKKRSWLLMALALVLVVTCAGPYYKVWLGGKLSDPGALTSIFSQGTDVSLPGEAYRAVLHNPQFLCAHLSYYFISLTEKLLGYGFTGLLILGVFFVPRLKKSYAQVLWIAIGVPLFVFIGILKKDHFYIFPLCVYFAMISGIGIYFVRGRWVRYLLILGIAGLTLMQYLFLFEHSRNSRKFFFSEQFEEMSLQKIPKLFLGGYGEPHKRLTDQVRLVAQQVIPMLNQRALSGERKQALVVDLHGHFLQHALVLLLRVDLQRAKVINAFYAWSQGADKDCDEDHLYLLSNRERYAVEQGPASGGGCSWKALEPLYRFSDSGITLYRVER